MINALSSFEIIKFMPWKKLRWGNVGIYILGVGTRNKSSVELEENCLCSFK